LTDPKIIFLGIAKVVIVAVIFYKIYQYYTIEISGEEAMPIVSILIIANFIVMGIGMIIKRSNSK